MKVIRIQAKHVAVPLAQPYVLSKRYGTVTEAQAVLVQVHTDQGIVGVGESNPMPPFTAETWGSVFAAIEHHLGPVLLGADPRDIAAHNVVFDSLLSGNLLAKGALDVALWDILGQSLSAPVHQLLGGAVRREVPLLWPFGSGTPEQDVERIAAKMKEGYRTFMIKMGALPIEVEIQRAQAIEKAYGGQIRVNMDANQGWDVAQTLAFMEGTRDCRIDFVEQPLPVEQGWANGLLRARATHPLSADEGLQTMAQAAALAGSHAVDVFSLKVAKNGGISRSRDIAALARGFGISCLMNSMIELGVSQAAVLHLAAAIPNLLDCGQCLMSTLRLADDVTDFSKCIESAVAKVGDAPGLGVTLDTKKLARYTRDQLEID